MSKEFGPSYEFGSFRLNVADRVLSHEGKEIPLETKVFELLLILVRSSGHLLTKQELMEQVWPDVHVEESGLTSRIAVLRKALDDPARQPKYIRTVSKQGYRFIAPVTELNQHEPAVVQPLQEPAPDSTPPLTSQPFANPAATLNAGSPPAVAPSLIAWWKRLLTQLIVILAVLLLALLALIFWWKREPPFRPVPVPPLRECEFDVVTLDELGRERERRRGRASYFSENHPEGLSLEMAAIPAGEFLMGTSEAEAAEVEREYVRHMPPHKRAELRQRVAWESPQHRVTIPAFYLGRYEVTQAQWRFVAKLPRVSRDLNPEPSEHLGDDLPVTHVSWEQAREFCARLAVETGLPYRLPSEAEWEYACRAGTTTAFHFGPTISSCYANFNDKFPYGQAAVGTYRGRTTPVGSYKVANAFGLFDMHGNVFEWCLDAMGWTYLEVPADGSAHKGEDRTRVFRVTRGGAFGNDNPPEPERWKFFNFCAFDCRVTKRSGQPQINFHRDLGFRVALSAYVAR